MLSFVKKPGSYFLAVIMTAVMLTGCSGSQPAPSESTQSIPAKSASTQSAGTDEKKQVTVSWFTETTDETGTVNFKKFYLEPLAKALPNIKIDWRPTADWDKTLKIELAAGQGADLLSMDGPAVAAEYVEADRLTDLTPYGGKYGWDKIIYPWAYNICKANDKLMSIPNGIEALVMYYRTDVFSKNGWSMPTGAAAFDKLLKDEKAAGYIPMSFGTAGDVAPNEHWISVALNCYAGSQKVKEALQGKAKWTDPDLKAAFQKLVDLWQNGYLSERNSQSVNMQDASALLAQGRASMAMNGTWCFWVYSTFYPDMPWDVTAIPNLKDDSKPVVPVSLSGVWAINKNSKVADASADIINFLLTNPELNVKGVEEADYTPLPIGLKASMFSDKIDSKKLKMYDMLFKAQESGEIGYCTWTFWPPKTRNYLMENIDGVFLGQTTLDVYLDKMQKIFDEELAAGKVPKF